MGHRIFLTAANTTASGAQIGMDIFQAIQTAPTYGFYGAVTDTLSTTTAESQANYTTNSPSTLYATNDINLTSNSNLTISGSNLYSNSGDINLRSKEGNVDIEAAKNTINSSSESNSYSISETASVSGGGIWVSLPTISASNSSSDLDSTSYLSSSLAALNGTININAKEDTNVKGSNILASNINIITNNLNVESLQSKLNSSSNSNSYSAGGIVGFNNSNNNQDRLWTDNIASIIGTNSVTINTENNTNIIGGVIANSTNGAIGKEAIDGKNLTLNTKTITYLDLNDYNNTTNDSLGINVALPIGLGTQTDPQTGEVMWSKPLEGQANLAYSQIMLNYINNSTNQTGTTKATLGQGTITLGDDLTINRDNITGEVTSIAGGEIITSNNSKISNLNRDLTNNQITNDTSYEGGYDISLTITPGVLIESYNQFQSGTLAQTARTNLGGTGEKLYGLTPMGASELIEGYTGQEMTWKPGDVARFKEKGREFETAVVGALTIGMANTIDPNDPKYANRLHLIGQPITADPDYYKTKLTWANEGGGVSSTNIIPGFNSMSVFHDKFTEETFLGKPGLLQLSILPAIPINYYGLIGKSIRNIYEDPKNNNLTGSAQ